MPSIIEMDTHVRVGVVRLDLCGNVETVLSYESACAAGEGSEDIVSFGKNQVLSPVTTACRSRHTQKWHRTDQLSNVRPATSTAAVKRVLTVESQIKSCQGGNSREGIPVRPGYETHDVA
jgi:hypothetical protein